MILMIGYKMVYSGTGKTTKLKTLKSASQSNEHITVCPTHKACKLINGNTIHKIFGISPIDLSYEYRKAQALKYAGIKYIS